MREFSTNCLVLVVEDNPDDEILTVRSLRTCGIETNVVVAHDGSEAIDFLFNGKPWSGASAGTLPDLILLDLKLPKVSGIELLQKLRHHSTLSAIPVVVLSSSDEQRDIDDCFRFGANSYVCKPVDYAQFTHTIQGLGRYWLTTNRLPAHTAHV